MKVKIELELDTDKPQDLDMIEEVIFQLQDVRDLLEVSQKNLNKTTTQKKTTRRK